MSKIMYTNEYQKITERIKQARLDSGLTQREVASKLKKSQSYLSKIEAGEQRVDIIELKNLAQIYKIKIDYFL